MSMSRRLTGIRTQLMSVRVHSVSVFLSSGFLRVVFIFQPGSFDVAAKMVPEIPCYLVPFNYPFP